MTRVIDHIAFILNGNQEDPAGNPIPYTRTIRGRWRADAVRYMAWKKFVVQEFLATREGGDSLKNVIDTGFPILLDKGQKARMEIMIYWKDHTHSDPDNVFKGIADSLFKQDKNVAGSMDFEMSPDKKGKVEVSILIYENGKDNKIARGSRKRIPAPGA